MKNVCDQMSTAAGDCTGSVVVFVRTACSIFTAPVSEDLRAVSKIEGTRRFPGLYKGGPSPLMLLEEALVFVTVRCSEANKREYQRLCSRGIVLRQKCLMLFLTT